MLRKVFAGGSVCGQKPSIEHGVFLLYHGTSRRNIKKILKEGLKSPCYFTRNLEFAKQFGQAVLVIKKRVNYFTDMGNDEISFGEDIKPSRIIRVLYHKEKPKYHNREDYDFPNWWINEKKD